MKLVVFNDHSSQLHPLIEPGQRLLLARVYPRAPRPGFSHGQRIEVFVMDNSIVELDSVVALTPPSSPPLPVPCRFVPLSRVPSYANGTRLDVIAMIKSIPMPFASFSQTLGGYVTQGEVNLADPSGEVSFTLWDDQVNQFEGMPGHVLVLRCCHVSDNEGRRLSTFGQTTMELDPDCEEAVDLHDWWLATNCDLDGLDELFAPPPTPADEGDEQNAPIAREGDWDPFAQCDQQQQHQQQPTPAVGVEDEQSDENAFALAWRTPNSSLAPSLWVRVCVAAVSISSVSRPSVKIPLFVFR